MYRVTDCPFNRANYAHLIGRVFDVPPAYAVVEPIIVDVVGILNQARKD